MTHTVTVAKANEIGGREVPTSIISISAELSHIRDEPVCDKERAYFRLEAKKIADALWRSLPGGTLSQLVAEMLERSASVYRVPFGKD